MSNKKKFIISGKLVDLATGQKVHSCKTNDLKSFEEMFTEPLKKKMS